MTEVAGWLVVYKFSGYFYKKDILARFIDVLTKPLFCKYVVLPNEFCSDARILVKLTDNDDLIVLRSSKL